MPSLLNPRIDITDPDLLPLLEQWDLRGGTAPFEIAEKREAYRAAVVRFGLPQTIWRVSDHAIPNGEGHSIPIRVYQPREHPAEPLPVLLYLHGGGFIAGDLETHDPVCRALAFRVPAVVVAVQYRLAPEFRYPAAHDDCFAVFQYLQSEASSWGGLADRIYIAGDSAGGLLAAATALRAYRALLPLPAKQVLIYPMLDATLSSPSLVSNALIPPFTLLDCVYVWQQYLQEAALTPEQDVSPLLSSFVHGLPPTLIITAGLDILCDEGMRFAERLQKAGVAVQIRAYPSMVHGFFQWHGTVQAARSAMDDVVNFLQTSC